MLLQAMGEYEIRNCEFIIYKQTQISERYIGIPNSLNVKYVSVPNLGMGIKRVIFEQTLFYKYLEPCDVLYSYCTSMPLFAKCKKYSPFMMFIISLRDKDMVCFKGHILHL